jgi:hypothetical protein
MMLFAAEAAEPVPDESTENAEEETTKQQRKMASDKKAERKLERQGKKLEQQGKKLEQQEKKRAGKFAAPLDVNLPMKHAPKVDAKKKNPKFLRGKKSASAAALSFDQVWRQYIDSEGFLEQYLTDELINILLVIAVVLCLYTFYRVFRVHKELAKIN